MVEKYTAGADPEELLGQLIRDHSVAMYRVAVAIVRDHALAEDVTQESLVRAWLAIDSYRGEGGLRAWLLRITHNTAVSMLRKERDTAYDPSDLPERTDVRQADEAEVLDLRSALNEALDSLDPLNRAIVVLRDVEGRSYDEIAHILETTVSVVKSRLFRSRRRLERALREVDR